MTKNMVLEKKHDAKQIAIMTVSLRNRFHIAHNEREVLIEPNVPVRLTGVPGKVAAWMGSARSKEILSVGATRGSDLSRWWSGHLPGPFLFFRVPVASAFH